MSVDFKIFSVCDHRISKELVQIESDLRTIPIPRVVSSVSNITLYINGFEIKSDNPTSGFTIEDDNRSYQYQLKKVVFKKKRKSSDDFFEISYSVFPKLCPKCMGQKVLNDESYNNIGLANTVSNEEKLLQEVKKGLLTLLGSNRFHTWWGTKISQLIGTKVYNADSIRAIIIQEVTIFLDKYLDIQTQQSQYQSVTDRESFYQTLLVDVEPNPDEPTFWTLTVIFQNRNGRDMVFEKKFEMPSQLNANFSLGQV